MTWTTKVSNGDEVRNTWNNGYETVEKINKAKQDVKMTLGTEVRRNGLGCGLEEVIGKDSENPTNTFSKAPALFEIQMRVRTGLSRLRQLQRTKQASHRYPSEVIHEFSPVQVWPIADDPRNFYWRVDVMTVMRRASFQINGKVRY